MIFRVLLVFLSSTSVFSQTNIVKTKDSKEDKVTTKDLLDVKNVIVDVKFEVASKDMTIDGKRVPVSLINAIDACTNYREADREDWILPDKHTLKAIYELYKAQKENSTFSNSFATEVYWSSSKDFANYVWGWNFGNGNLSTNDIRNAVNYVRCVRAI